MPVLRGPTGYRGDSFFRFDSPYFLADVIRRWPICTAGTGDKVDVSRGRGAIVTPSAHALATHHLPIFITAPGDTDVLAWITGIALLLALLIGGNLFLKLHSLPERMAHKSQKLQFEIVAVLCLLALFTHIHLFWVAGLLLAFIDLPDFATPLRRIARSTETLAGIEPPPDSTLAPDDEEQGAARGHKRGDDHA